MQMTRHLTPPSLMPGQFQAACLARSITPRVMVAYTLLILTILTALPLQADSLQNYEQAKETAMITMAREDTQRAIEIILSRPTAEDAMHVFELVVRDLYWQSKNLNAALLIGRAGIQFGLTEARRVAGHDQALAHVLTSRSKMLAYNLSSFCWPGWQAQGIDIPAVYLAQGQDLAKTNMRLAKQLRKGDLPMSRAWWLMGAHHLAVGHYERARRAFVEGTRFAIAAQTRESELMLRGYVYLSDMLKHPDNERLAIEFGFVLAELEKSQEGRFFGEQLETALLVFEHQRVAAAVR
ncbi:MAG: hypothetical protein ACI8PP_001317 [Candidatus Pseudothioglobus sp.]|jgi:hypothetical protein